ncbi:MAG: HAMP domain-containing histidine kinase, partial [Nitrospirae bacterium]|nr:HAMP domain-containing histidine kinase [Nitrospirota bacterium]
MQLIESYKELLEQKDLLIQQSKMASMGEMISMISHQWRQPLNAISITVQDIIEAYAYGELNEGYIKDTVNTTMDQVKFMSRTMDEFRNFFKPSKEKVPFDVKSTIENILSMFYQMFKKSDNIDISIITEPGTILLTEGYPNEFKQVILNILNNAKDAIISQRDAGGTKQGLVEINIKNCGEGDKVIVSIRDNGGGIPEHIIDKIFEPYYTTKGNAGTGIGLYMSKTIVETNMGGTLTVKNVDGGAEFQINLEAQRVMG